MGKKLEEKDKNKTKAMRRKMKLPKKKADWTAAQRKEWNAYLLESCKSFEDYLIAWLERDQAKSDKARERLERKARAPEELAAKEEKGSAAEREGRLRLRLSRRSGRANSGRRTIRKWRIRPIPKARRSGL